MNTKNTTNISFINNTEDHKKITEELPIWFKHVLPMIIIAIGVLGNTIAIVALSKKQYRKISTCYYMLALAYSDNFVMILFVVRWINRLPQSPLKHNTTFCIMYFFCIRLGLGLSAWILMLLTFDRFIAIWYPFRAKLWCTVNRARICLLIIGVVQVLSHIPYFWRYSNPDGKTFSSQCPYNLPKNTVEAYVIARIVLFDRLVPWIIILVFTIAMTIELCQSTRRRQVDLNCTTSKDIPRRVAAMSLVVAWAFFILTFPTSIYEGVRTFSTHHQFTLSTWLYELFVYLLYLNSAINFYLYISVAKKFRNDVNTLICKKNIAESSQ